MTSTSTIDQGSKAVLGKSSQENKILTDCSTVVTVVIEFGNFLLTLELERLLTGALQAERIGWSRGGPPMTELKRKVQKSALRSDSSTNASSWSPSPTSDLSDRLYGPLRRFRAEQPSCWATVKIRDATECEHDVIVFKRMSLPVEPVSDDDTSMRM